MLSETIRHTYLLHGLNHDQVAAIAAIANVREYDGGQTIVRQFSRDDGVAIVLEGTARVKGFSGETLCECGPGSIVGEMSLVDDQPRSANVVSVGRSKIVVIPGDKLWTLLDSDAVLARTFLHNLCRVLSMRLRTASIHLDLTQGKSVAPT
ncbi:cyclic nucleotide-binding domain-containing protein [bacterium]|nr:MAG: cyclic nucleotide-binding domain-containing protein [bacterium]